MSAPPAAVGQSQRTVTVAIQAPVILPMCVKNHAVLSVGGVAARISPSRPAVRIRAGAVDRRLDRQLLERYAQPNLPRAQDARRARLARVGATAGRNVFASFMAMDPAPEITRFPLLLTVIFGDQLPPEEFACIIRINRARHEATLAAYRRRLSEMEREHPYPALTMRFGPMYEEMCLRWFDSLPTAEG